MRPVTSLTGRAVAIRRANIDTDQIIPALWMKRVERAGYQDGLFEIWRKDAGFPLNQPERAGAAILIAGPNFGCGSSREHAVWALRDWGIRAVISTEIADIHRANLPAEGLVPVEAPERVVARLMDATDADPAVTITIDIEHRTITCAAAGVHAEPFELDYAPHYSLVNGYDPVDLTLQFAGLIGQHERDRDPWLPAGRP